MKSNTSCMIILWIVIALFLIVPAVSAGTYIYYDQNGKVVMELPKETIQKESGKRSDQSSKTESVGSEYPHQNNKNKTDKQK
ncbi:MAG: hypothetical protein ABIJ31_07110 [Pseudomonadota bacterium]